MNICRGIKSLRRLRRQGFIIEKHYIRWTMNGVTFYILPHRIFFFISFCRSSGSVYGDWLSGAFKLDFPKINLNKMGTIAWTLCKREMVSWSWHDYVCSVYSAYTSFTYPINYGGEWETQFGITLSQNTKFIKRLEW